MKLSEDVSTVEDFGELELEDKSLIHEGLYEQVELIDEFIDENPEDFPMNELALISN